MEVAYGGSGGWDPTVERFSLVFILGDLEKGLNLLRHWKQIENNTIKKNFLNQNGKETYCLHCSAWTYNGLKFPGKK